MQLVQLLYMYVDLGHILEWGFNLASKKFTFLFEKLLYGICLSERHLSNVWQNVVAPSDFTWIFLTGFAKTWLQKFPSYTFTESCCGTVLFVIFYQIFTEYAAVERLSWVSYWILMSPPPQKNMVFIISHKTFCISVWNQCAYLTELIVVGCHRAFSCLEQSFPLRHH